MLYEVITTIYWPTPVKLNSIGGDQRAIVYPAAFQVEFVHVIGEGLDQDRHVQPGELDRFDRALFIAKVGQADQNTVDFVGVLAEKRA